MGKEPRETDAASSPPKIEALVGNRRLAAALSSAFATDAAGTWAISALGAGAIDDAWGAGTALAMWRTVRARCGRTEAFAVARPDDLVAGLDFTDSMDDRPIDG